MYHNKYLIKKTHHINPMGGNSYSRTYFFIKLKLMGLLILLEYKIAIYTTSFNLVYFNFLFMNKYMKIYAEKYS